MYQVFNKSLDELPKTLQCMIEAFLDTGNHGIWGVLHLLLRVYTLYDQ